MVRNIVVMTVGMAAMPYLLETRSYFSRLPSSPRPTPSVIAAAIALAEGVAETVKGTTQYVHAQGSCFKKIPIAIDFLLEGIPRTASRPAHINSEANYEAHGPYHRNFRDYRPVPPPADDKEDLCSTPRVDAAHLQVDMTYDRSTLVKAADTILI
ncbi:hypothetical protein BDV26DRAFT_288759 [Aspergillus bertholletiae]|uniref:Uncharacterized protein n=1 Tax=Aspergillus bertholletiae TaxID=1226010 RepID=A0A5N7BK95_9EURO|nr:hypothetical protein BDV26DRAFT_288759 [Aspergillus bertholletiae]